MSTNRPGVLDEKAVHRHTQLGLTDDDVWGMYRFLLLTRALDERMWVLKRQGKVPFTVSGQGQEGAQVGAAFALRKGMDYSFPYYRDMGFALVMGMTARDMMLSVMTRAEDPSSGGRQMPGHFGSRRLRIISGSSPVATQIPQAAGVALASRLSGEDAVTWVSFGDGATSKGDFHEGLNFAAIHKLPVIFFCENNGYAISVPLSRQMAVKTVAERAAAYGFPGVTIDGMDVFSAYEATKEAALRGRRGEGPTLIEAKVYRFMPHSSDDNDARYRSPQEVAEWKARDPIVLLRSYMHEHGLLTEEKVAEVEAWVKDQVNDATAYADAAPLPDPKSALRYVYHEG